VSAGATFIAAALMLALTCAREPPPTGAATTMDPNELRIREGTSTNAGGLMIGAGNFWDEDGQPTCGLSLSSPYRTERVRAGQVLEHAGRRIAVLRLERDGGKGVVVLEVRSSPDAG
jgi:hypothetical protein